MGLQYGKVLCTLAFKAAAPKQNLGQRSGTISYNRIEDKSTTVTFHITNSLPQRQGALCRKDLVHLCHSIVNGISLQVLASVLAGYRLVHE